MSLLPPNLFLLGAPKAGTSAIADVLRRHPKIYCEKKEPRFFDAHIFHDDPAYYPLKSLDDYLLLYKNDNAQNSLYRLDASTFSIYDERIVRTILDISPDSRFIVILRDPIDASRSMHRQRLRYSDTKLREVSDDFMTCWNQLKARSNGQGFPKGCRNKILFQYDVLYHYERYIPNIISAVKPNPFLVLDYQELRTNPESLFKKLEVFLDLGSNQFSSPEKVNISRYVENTLSNRLRQKIFYLIASKTRNLRRHLGLVGYKLKITEKNKDNMPYPFEGEIQLDELKDEFSDTYDYLNKVFDEKNINETA